MKKRILIRFCLAFLTSSFLLVNSSKAQNKGLLYSVRIMLQSDAQKEFYFSGFPEIDARNHSKNTTNYGFDLLVEKEIATNLNAHIGVGHFRNRFNLKRHYDHNFFNGDSTQILYGTYYYTYNLFRFPIGLSYKIADIKKFSFGASIEDIISCRYNQIYNGLYTDKLSKVEYFGNSVVFSLFISRQFSPHSSLQLSPFIRVLNTYKRNNSILFDETKSPYSRQFDAFGISLKYSFSFQKKHK